MQLEGRVWKSKKFWMAEIPAVDYLTQGRTKSEAYRMAKDIVLTGVDRKGFAVSLTKQKGNTFVLSSNDPGALVALMLRRQRQKNGLTVRQASERLGSASPNAFGAYEQGKISPTIEKLEELLRVVSGGRALSLKVT